MFGKYRGDQPLQPCITEGAGKSLRESIERTFVNACCMVQYRRQRESSGDKGQPWGFLGIKVCNYGATGTITEMICVDPNGATNDRRKASSSIDDTSYEKRTIAFLMDVASAAKISLNRREKIKIKYLYGKYRD